MSKPQCQGHKQNEAERLARVAEADVARHGDDFYGVLRVVLAALGEGAANRAGAREQGAGGSRDHLGAALDGNGVAADLRETVELP